jgi:hypothetical protein
MSGREMQQKQKQMKYMHLRENSCITFEICNGVINLIKLIEALRKIARNESHFESVEKIYRIM